MIIGLAGEALTGKSTFAKMLVEHHGFEERSFAKNLKEMCRNVFDLSENQVYTQEGKKEFFPQPKTLLPEHLVDIDFWIKSVTRFVEVDKNGLSKAIKKYWEGEKILFKNTREILQFVGTEICRECYKDTYHIEVATHDMKDNISYVFSDARFLNERKEVAKREGKNILIEGPAPEEKLAGIEGHQSEAEMKEGDYDYVFFNDKMGGLDALKFKVDQILKTLKEQQ